MIIITTFAMVNENLPLSSLFFSVFFCILFAWNFPRLNWTRFHPNWKPIVIFSELGCAKSNVLGNVCILLNSFFVRTHYMSYKSLVDFFFNVSSFIWEFFTWMSLHFEFCLNCTAHNCRVLSIFFCSSALGTLMSVFLSFWCSIDVHFLNPWNLWWFQLYFHKITISLTAMSNWPIWFGTQLF